MEDLRRAVAIHGIEHLLLLEAHQCTWRGADTATLSLQGPVAVAPYLTTALKWIVSRRTAASLRPTM